MLRLGVFAGFAGFHLAVLQFCYFFLLLINVTSTYITYITVVVSWMVGTMIGLAWRRLKPMPSLIVGVLAYYLTSLLVFSAPLASFTLPVAAFGVAATGLWAGHLFVALLPLFNRADRLFLHENNGFLLGIVGVFIGFTLLGQPFLLVAPLVSLAVQLALLFWLRVNPPTTIPQPVSDAPMEAGTPLVVLSDTVLGRLKAFTMLAVILNLLLPAGTLIHSALAGESYWQAFHGEDNAITWFSSIQLVFVGLMAYAIFHASGLLADLAEQVRPPRRWIWLVFAVGFIFLSIDERFELHELLREDAMRPAALFTGIPWMRDGDIGLVLYLCVGVAFALVLMQQLRRHRLALWLFLGAIAVSAAIVVVDIVPEEMVQTWPWPMFWNSVFEEAGELCGQLLFLLSFTLFLLAQVGEIRQFGMSAGENR